MAFHNLVYKIERALEDGLVTLGGFLDTENVSDNTAFKSTCKVDEKHGMEQGVVRRIYARLEVGIL
jgi:hypothetical protein